MRELLNKRQLGEGQLSIRKICIKFMIIITVIILTNLISNLRTINFYEKRFQFYTSLTITFFGSAKVKLALNLSHKERFTML